MNDYIVTYSPMGGVHLEHRSHKYITRKWKNGRWVYTYPKENSSTQFFKSRYEINAADARGEAVSSNALKYKYDEEAKYYNNAQKELKDYEDQLESKQKELEDMDKPRTGPVSLFTDINAERKKKESLKEDIKHLKSMIQSQKNIIGYSESIKSIKKDDYDAAVKRTQAYGKNAQRNKDEYHRTSAQNARKMHQEIKKWESTPLSKIQTYAHKAADAISNWLKKHK